MQKVPKAKTSKIPFYLEAQKSLGMTGSKALEEPESPLETEENLSLDASEDPKDLIIPGRGEYDILTVVFDSTLTHTFYD